MLITYGHNYKWLYSDDYETFLNQKLPKIFDYNFLELNLLFQEKIYTVVRTSVLIRFAFSIDI